MRIVSAIMTLFLMFFSWGCESDSNSNGTTAATTTTSTISFSITAISDASISTLYTSDDINVTGITGTASVSLTNGTLLKNGVDVGSLTTTMVDGDYLAIRLTSSSQYETAVSATLTVGGVSQTFTVTTTTSNQPNSFSFTSVTGASLSTVYTSNSITIGGLDTDTNVSASFNDGGNTADVYLNGSMPSSNSSFTVTNGDVLYIKLTASSSYATTLSATLTVGATSASYSVKSMSAPTLSVTPASLSLSYNETATLSAAISPSSVDGNVTYASSDTSVATVNATTGVVTAIGEGTATITATADLASPHGTANDTVAVTVSMDTLITAVTDKLDGSAAKYNTLVPNASFVDVVLDHSDAYAFIADYIGISIIDINKSSSNYMDEVGTVDLNRSEHVVRSFYSSDDRLFVAAGQDGLVTVDVSTPSSPTILAQYNADYNDSAKYAWSVALAGSHTTVTKAFVVNCYGVDMFDVSNSSTITRLDELNISGGNCTDIANKTNKYDIVINSNYAFVAYGDQGVQVVDWTTTLDTLDLNGSYSSATCTDARGLDIDSENRKTLYVACGADGVDILDISDPQNITKYANYTPTASGADVEDVKLSSDGDYLLVTHGIGVELIDVSTPASPSLVGMYTSGGYAFSTVFDSNDSYYYLSDDNALRKLELTYQ